MMILPIVAVFVIGIGAMFYFNPPAGANLAKIHAHAAFALVVDGKTVDLSKSEYMVRDSQVHLEDLDGSNIHTHKRDADLGRFFGSIGMSHDNITNCFTNVDGEEYCNDPVSKKKLRFWINGEELGGALENHVIADKDRILVVYGNEDPIGIKQYVDILNAVQIKEA